MSVEQQLFRSPPPRDAALTIGTFDGVHLGHQRVFRCLKEESSARGLLALAVAFRNHPRTVLAPGSKVEYLTSWTERKSLIKGCGVDRVVALDFTNELSLIRARAFVEMLAVHLRMKGLVVGPDFALGHRREGDIPTLKALGEELGFWLRVVEPEVADSHPIRSRVLRQLIAAGEVEAAARMLGRTFALTGRVARGDGRGRDLGFPTANLAVKPDLLVPGDGIYATWAHVGGARYQSATSVGVRPTFGPGPRSVEAFIMDFSGDIYGEPMTLEFVSRLRAETAFASVAELVGQMRRDVDRARSVLALAVR